MSTRPCRTCGNYKSPDQYYSLASGPDGLHPDCKDCCKVSRALENVRKRDKRSKISVRQRVRAQGLGIKFDADITLAKIFKRDRGHCHLCTKWVQPRHASMDHDIPLSKGGTHTWGNVRLTHIKCNLRKGDRTTEQSRRQAKKLRW